jgi:hypothetical protein
LGFPEVGRLNKCQGEGPDFAKTLDERFRSPATSDTFAFPRDHTAAVWAKLVATKRVKIHYRRLLRQDGTFPPNKSLQDRISAAMDATKPDGSRVRDKAKYRLASVPNNEGSQRLLNTYHVEATCVFGTVCLTSPGQLQALIKVTDGAHPNIADVMAQLEIAEAAAPSGQEYVHGMTYWTVLGDHFYQIQHVSMQAKAMEEYLTWLLRDAGSISATEAVMLQWKFDRSQVGDDELESIQIGGLMPETVYEAPPTPPGTEVAGVVQDVETRETFGERVAATFAKARQVIVDLIGEVETAKIISAMPPDAALDVRVNIGFKARKRKLKREVMANLEAGLRNIADGEIVAKGKNGEVRGNDARLSMDMNVRRISETSSLLDPEDALRQILEVHRRFLHDSKID